MKLLSLSQTSIRETDMVFRTSGLASGIAAAVMWGCVGAAGYLAVFGQIGTVAVWRPLAAAVGLFLLFVAWITGMSFRASRRPSNWLVRVRGNELLIKFRSYENWRMCEDDIQVIELPRQEIEFVRQLRQNDISGATNHGTQVRRRVDLEIGLKNRDTALLEEALAAEAARPGWGSGSQKTKFLEYPVQAADGAIRIAWSNGSGRIRPGIRRAIAELGRVAPVAAEACRDEDFTPAALQKLGPDEQRKQLAALAQRDVIAAIETAKKLYGCSLAQGKEIVDQITLASRKPGNAGFD